MSENTNKQVEAPAEQPEQLDALEPLSVRAAGFMADLAEEFRPAAEGPMDDPLTLEQFSTVVHLSRGLAELAYRAGVPLLTFAISDAFHLESLGVLTIPEDRRAELEGAQAEGELPIVRMDFGNLECLIPSPKLRERLLLSLYSGVRGLIDELRNGEKAEG